MRYTMQTGVQRPVLSRITGRYKYLIPLLLLLVFVGYAGLAPSGPGRRPGKPLTLGIYTIKSSDNRGPAAANPSKDNHKPSGSTANSATMSPASPAITTPAPAYSATGTALQGGMGGGTSDGGDITLPGGGGSPSPPSTFPCTDISSGVTVTCTYQTCAPPISLLGSQKAYLTTTGTCVIVN